MNNNDFTMTRSGNRFKVTDNDRGFSNFFDTEEQAQRFMDTGNVEQGQRQVMTSNGGTRSRGTRGMREAR